MKTLASCTPIEFARQTVLIKNYVAKWLTDTDILNIRKQGTVGVDGDAKQVMKHRLSAMFDAIFAEHPEETIKLLALVCFVPVEEVNDHKMNEYFSALNELINDEAVVGFFISLLGLAQKITLKA